MNIGYLHRDRMCPEGLLHKDYCVIEAGSSGRTQTLMTLAILNGSYQTVKVLATDVGVNCQEKDSHSHTYLHIAAISGHVNIFCFFLSKQVSPNSRNDRNLTAIELAEGYGHQHLVDYYYKTFLE